MSEIIEWRTKSVAELREVLKNRHLDTSGTKAILVARLEVNQEAGVCDRMREEIRKLEEEIRHHRNLERVTKRKLREESDHHQTGTPTDPQTGTQTGTLTGTERELFRTAHAKENSLKQLKIRTVGSHRQISGMPTGAGSVQRNTIGDTLLLAIFRRQEAVKVWMTVPRNGAMNNDRHAI